MAKMFTVIVFCLTFFCAYPITAQSPAPSQEIKQSAPKQERATPSGSPTQTSQHKENSNNHQNTANKLTISVDEKKPPIENDTSKIKNNYEAQNLEIQRQLAESTKTIAYFTIALVLVGVSQAIIFLKQVNLLNKTLKETKFAAEAANTSAKAAKESADILQITERAYVFATVFLMGVIDFLQSAGEKKVTIDLKNCGRTPAIIKDFYVKVGIYQGYPINETLLDSRASLYDPFVYGDRPLPEYLSIFNLDENGFNKIIDRSHFLVCFGCIKYITLFGQEHFHGFCWEYNVVTKKFVLSENDELNYNT